ncbi:hypothetical protein [Methanogenium organophilum]|uniref:Uncharacterized protein n=1 Tax=Methanogenium organophilum TaxID=2199 RepID=A0A9X9T7H4_METOG|nr:hypothetical protein [Methanogenium organophilum]WAI00401.1 hypothetical protein OU421_08150 [Methanogenium organophilum]
MSPTLPHWKGFDNIKTLNPQFDEESFDVLCLPENIETTTNAENYIETAESLRLYKILKSKGVNVLALHDFGIKTPLYERRCDDLYFGTILVKEIALPIIVTILSTWITSKLFNPKIHLKLKIQKPEKIVSIDYLGDGETLNQILNSINHSENEEL